MKAKEQHKVTKGTKFHKADDPGLFLERKHRKYSFYLAFLCAALCASCPSCFSFWLRLDYKCDIVKLAWRKYTRRFVLLLSSFGLGLLLGGCDQAEHVRFQNGEIALAGEVFKPEASGSYPAVVFMHEPGAGANDDFRTLAKLLAEQGLVSLLYDRPDMGDFSGAWTKADLQTLAGDALAAVQYLQQRPDVQKHNIGLSGFDRGGWIAPLAASASPDIAFLIIVSTAFVPPRETLNDDPLPLLRNLRAPVLMLFGEKDDSVAVEESVTLITTTMRSAGKKNFACRVLPNAGHDLYTRPFHDSPLPLLQSLPLSPRFDPEALEAMVYWIKVVSPLHRSQAK